MKARTVVWVLLAVLAIYLVIVGSRGVFLLGQPEPVLKVLGSAILTLPLLAAWLVWREVRFGLTVQQLGEQMAADGAPEPTAAQRTPGGRVDRAAADRVFETVKDEVEASPKDWHGWFRLAIAYDDAGDRRRARSAMGQAIRLSRPAPRAR